MVHAVGDAWLELYRHADDLCVTQNDRCYRTRRGKTRKIRKTNLNQNEIEALGKYCPVKSPESHEPNDRHVLLMIP